MASLHAGVAYVDIHPNMDQFNRTLSRGVNTKLGGISRAIGKGLKFAAIGFTALGGAAAYAFGQFEESEKIARQTEAVIKSTGGTAKVTAKQVAGLAASISHYSGIDDEAIQSGENMLLTFTNIRNEVGKGNDIFDQTSKTLIDLSVAMGTEPQQAAIQLGKALNDPIKGITALTRVGVTFNDEQKKEIERLVKHNDLLGAQKIILKELNKEFGGSAKAQATASGKMKVALGDLAEVVGKLVAPAVEFLTRQIRFLAKFLGRELPDALAATQAWLRKAEEWLLKVWDAVQPAIHIYLPLLIAAFHAVQDAVKENLPQLKELWKSLRPILIAAGKLAAVLLYIALKVLPVVIRVYAKWIHFQLILVNALLKVYGAVIRVGVAIGGAVAHAWTLVKKWGGMILDWFKELPGKAAHAIASLPSAVGNVFKSLVNIIIGWWNRLDIGFHLPSWIPGGIGGHGIDDLFPDITPLAEGGIVRRPTLAMVGESGPEAITPLGGRGQMHVIVDNPHDFTNDNENVRLDRRMARSER